MLLCELGGEQREGGLLEKALHVVVLLLVYVLPNVYTVEIGNKVCTLGSLYVESGSVGARLYSWGLERW